mgnify:FL=1
MELIKYTRKIINKNGVKISCGLFYCEHCKNYVERRLSNGKRAKSCGCKQFELISKSNGGENNSFYGKHHTKEVKELIKKSKIGKKNFKLSKTRIEKGIAKGKNNPMYGSKRIGKLNPNWQGGKSFEEYPQEFNKELKQFIYERDSYTCQDPTCEHKTNKLAAHHIDYDKTNNNPENIVTLCNSCHSKTNGKNNRQYWTEFYQNIMFNRIMECLL